MSDDKPKIVSIFELSEDEEEDADKGLIDVEFPDEKKITCPNEKVIDYVRLVVEKKDWKVINGTMADLFSASIVILVYDNCQKPENQATLRRLAADRLIEVCLETYSRVNRTLKARGENE